MEKKKDNKELIRSIKFLLFSISAGLIQAGSTVLCNEVFHFNNTVSYVIGLVLSVIWNFTLNRRYTFKSANNVPLAMLKVAAFYVVFTPLSTLLVNFLGKFTWWGLISNLTVSEYLADGLNMILNLILEFLYDRFFVFKDSIDTNDLAKKDEENK